MNNTKLKKAMILGTIALIWTIPSVNLFGVIAVIVSWIAYSNSKKIWLTFQRECISPLLL